jgi:hypothetical protein
MTAKKAKSAAKTTQRVELPEPFTASECEMILHIQRELETRYAEQFKRHKLTSRHALSLALDVVQLATEVGMCVQHNECRVVAVDLFSKMLYQLNASTPVTFAKFAQDSLSDVIDIDALEKDVRKFLM